MVLEDALGLWDDDELSVRFGMSVGELLAIRQLPMYRQSVAQTRKEVTEQGLTFKHKARLQAEQFLDSEMPKWICDPTEPLKDRLAALSKLVSWGELEPQPAAQQAQGGFVFVLNLPGAEPQTIATQNAIKPVTLDNQP